MEDERQESEKCDFEVDREDSHIDDNTDRRWCLATDSSPVVIWISIL
jgi:hypothetical protein